jgi:hypothetical protein
MSSGSDIASARRGCDLEREQRHSCEKKAEVAVRSQACSAPRW